jgi:hypothetical protein
MELYLYFPSGPLVACYRVTFTFICIFTASKKLKLKGLVEMKISRCIQLSSDLFEYLWKFDFIFMENVI